MGFGFHRVYVSANKGFKVIIMWIIDENKSIIEDLISLRASYHKHGCNLPFGDLNSGLTL